MKKGNLAFGLGAVVSGQKSSVLNAEPELIVNSTLGKFTITAPVSKALGVAVGENVMFFNNLDKLQEAIQNRVDVITEYANENGLDLDTVEGQQAIIDEFEAWWIAKGVLLYDAKGMPRMAKARFTETDKINFIKQYGKQIVEENRDALLERLDVEDATDEELLASLTIDDVEVPTFHEASGSKTATTSSATGVGLQLSFTDSNIWNNFKKDLPKDDRIKVNRKFAVDLESPFTTEYNNGKELVKVTAYPIVSVENSDSAPVDRTKKTAANDEATEE